MDITITDGSHNVNLNAEENALLDEISFERPEKRVPLKPKPTRPSVFSRKVPASAAPPPEDEGLDFFMNPSKRTAPPPPPPEEYDGAEEEGEEIGRASCRERG